MANSSQARKRARQAIKRRSHNMSLRSALRTLVKRVLHAITSGDQSAANEAYKNCLPVLDRMATKGLIHKNKAARHKQRLTHRIKTMA